MSQQVRVDADTYTIEVDEEIPAIVFRWDEFTSGQAFRDGSNELLEFIRDHDYHKMIIDTSNIKAHDEEDKRWLQETWIPKLIEAGIEYNVSVHADSVISETEMETFVDQAQDLPFTYVLADAVDEAREWLAEQ